LHALSRIFQETAKRRGSPRAAGPITPCGPPLTECRGNSRNLSPAFGMLRLLAPGGYAARYGARALIVPMSNIGDDDRKNR
jgi:hypothetical protein